MKSLGPHQIWNSSVHVP